MQLLKKKNIFMPIYKVTKRAELIFSIKTSKEGLFISRQPYFASKHPERVKTRIYENIAAGTQQQYSFSPSDRNAFYALGL